VTLRPTASQTVGPFFNIGLPDDARAELVPADDPDAIRLGGVVLDGAGEPVDDALIEIWQANRAGRYAHPEDPREEIPLEHGFDGFGRCGTDPNGVYGFVIVKPGPVPAPGGGMQAPHIEMSVFARGLLKRLATRVYFPDEAEANEADPVLSSIEDPAHRGTLVAQPEDAGLRFDIHLQGDRQTTFFSV
jgi:protocatechuate 3,4-dioxygenase, alpha subunit